MFTILYGHDDKSLTDAAYRALLANGIRWAAGRLGPITLPSDLERKEGFVPLFDGNPRPADAATTEQRLGRPVCDYISWGALPLSCRAERSAVETSGPENSTPFGLGQTPRRSLPHSTTLRAGSERSRTGSG